LCPHGVQRRVKFVFAQRLMLLLRFFLRVYL
jgi:hypothetical protein